MQPQYRLRKVTRRIIVHGSCLSCRNPEGDIVQHLRKKGREMGLLDVGYHFVIDREGEVRVGRALSAIGSHTPGHNHDSLGVFIECHDGTLSETQRLAFRVMVEAIAITRALLVSAPHSPLPVFGHNEVVTYRKGRDNNCPNFNMDLLRAS